jgi:predicted alpha/beta-fold hydrolase
MPNTFIYNSNYKADKLVIINHGVNEGIRSEFLTKISNKAYDAGFSTLLTQMKYKDRGESKSSSMELVEEIQTVKEILNSIDLSRYNSIHFVGKSLGGLIFNRYIQDYRNTLPNDTKLTFLGFLVEFAEINEKMNYPMNIIQGTKDKYGTKIQLDELLAKHKDIDFKVIYIENADHSYRNSEKLPVFQDLAIDSIKF